MSIVSRLLLVCGLALLGACRSAWYPYRYAPAPLEVRLDVPSDADAQGRALVSVIGVRRADSKADRPVPSVELRMRLENFGKKRLTVKTDEFKLVSASLEQFGPPQFQHLPKEPIAQGANAVFEIGFPFPDKSSPEDMNLSGLNLKWTVEYEGEPVSVGVTFERRFESYGPYYYDDPFYDPWCFHSGFGAGFGIGHARDD